MKSTARVLFGCHDNTIVGTLAVCATATNINEIETVPSRRYAVATTAQPTLGLGVMFGSTFLTNGF